MPNPVIDWKTIAPSPWPDYLREGRCFILADAALNNAVPWLAQRYAGSEQHASLLWADAARIHASAAPYCIPATTESREICSEQGKIHTRTSPNLWQPAFHTQKLYLENEDADIPGTQEQIWCALGFQAQLYDEETGLYYNHQRYYSPDTCQYLTSDPIALAGGLNLYAYSWNIRVL